MKPDSGTILRVNLSTGKINKEPLPEKIRANFIGGRGINSKILYDETGPATNPLSSQNKLIFGASPISGTNAPAVARFTVTAKSPLTGILGDANAGGFFGPELKLAGYDHVIIEGEAAQPVYIFIKDDKVEIREAKKLWGNNTLETDRLIKEELADGKVRVASIGQAGENKVLIASVMHEERAAARCGIGAVMGSKNLKALAVRGTGKVELAEPDRFNELAKELHKKAASTKLAEIIKKYGGAGGTGTTNRIGILALKNFSQTGGWEGADKFNPELIANEFYTGSKACYKCPIACSKKYEVKDGPYKGEKGNKIEEGCFTPFGPSCYNAYLPSIFKINNLVNQYGIDSLACGTMIGMVMDWYGRGIITSKDTDGIELTWGNYEAVIEMVHKIAKREGFGDILADGVVKAAKRVGRGAEKFISHSKGMSFGSIEVRVLKGLGLCLATSTRGCDHLRGRVPTETPGRSPYTPEEAEKLFGSKEVMKTTSYVKAAPAILYQHRAAVTDSMQICRFASEANGGGVEIKDMAELFSLATGISIDDDEMHRAGERIFNLERAYIVREGIRRKDDRLEGRWIEGEVSGGQFKGEKHDPVKWEEMLDDYYLRRGWDKNGIPTQEKLLELGLPEAAEDMKRIGR